MNTLRYPGNSSFLARHPRILPLLLPLAVLLLPGRTATAVTFTNDSAISSYNTNYDGLDVVVTNCTLTVDGTHSFASLQVLNGGNLAHTYAPGGVVNNFFTVTNEPQVLSLTNAATLANSNVYSVSIVVQDLSGQITYTNALDYMFVPVSNNMTILLLTPNSAIAEGSTNLVSYEYYSTVAAGLSLTVTGDVTVAQGGTIVADGKGYGGGIGTGHGNSSGSPQTGSGAGHGGFGGQGGSTSGPTGGTPYDSIQQPSLLGSGGGSGLGGVGGTGGGSINLVIGGTMRVDGTVTANGADALNDRSGGGSGGSIWLSAQNFAGTGLISANGGAGEPSSGGGGGGGRIALWYGTTSFPGTTAAHGGSGYVRGGAGTIYTRADSQFTGQLLVDNGGKTGATTTLSTGEALDLTVQGGATIPLLTSQTLGNLLIGSNAWISLANQTLTVTSNATIQAGGGISADGTGSAPGYGTGAGTGSSSPNGYVGGGGGYGGYGAAGGTPAYPYAFGGGTHGSLTSPTDLGGGGGSVLTYCVGGYGGGAVHVNVTGTLWLDGKISADGGAGVTEGGGGGSGGSVWLTVGTLTGAGTISANGGMGNGSGLGGGGGGGGGRIAVQYAMNLFFGTMSARGGSGAGAGGAGTIYTKANTAPWGLVLADNGGQAGTNTSWSIGGTIDLTVKGGAVVSPPGSQAIGTLLVASNGWVMPSSQSLTISGNATVQAGGGIIADGTGSASNQGTGAGKYSSSSIGYIGGGGAYGGYGAAGGAPSTYPAYGGSPYGSVTAPMSLGSGGGGVLNTSGPNTAGGAGGGAINLNVTGVLEVDGRVSAAGLPGAGASGGGGSGGSIYLVAGTLAGSGVISANGGLGNYLGGGGGGGRIAIQCGVYDFSGLLSAYGGGGYATGGAGTIYTKVSSQSSGLILMDNGGQAGTNTSFGAYSLGIVDLTVRGGAVLAPTISDYLPTIGTLLIASNGWVVPNGSAGSQTLTVSGNATIQAGGGLIADGTGYAGGSGTGAGGSSSGSSGGGGGHGGYGASGAPYGGYSANGGSTYGSVTAPTELGSGGGGSYSPALGGAGGGAIRLSVTGTLEVDGSISARGLTGTGSGGGGSGGSIYLTVGSLTGSGVIAANGGAGSGSGGGGGGGRIAVSYTGANIFAGLMSAYGGGGYARGGAGTIYTVAYNQSGQIVVDNGGQAGTNTSWPLAGTTVNVMVRGGALLSGSSSQAIGNLVVASNGWVSIASQTLTITGNATIQAGGGIIADGTGYAGGSGTGAGGASSSYSGGGGGHGGYGASGAPYQSSSAYGGNTYGSVTAPTELGSGGGGNSSAAVGGAGGGAIHLSVTGTLEVDGSISARGLAGTGSGGGGSGGSIYLTVGGLTGVGVIAANGGAGNGLGGGGGGGRIAVTYTGANTFAGLMSAYGGGGYAWGGAGTIYTSFSYLSQIVVDNGGQSGTNTGWPSGLGTTVGITLSNGACLAMPTSSQTIGNLLIGSNGWIYVSGSAGLNAPTLNVSGNATIQAGGGIIADSGGYSYYNGGTGPGNGTYYNSTSGGGGFGGSGGAGGGTTSAYGGHAVGLATQGGPGSAGGGSGSYFVGGSGGGGISLNVTGVLEVGGRISSAGGTGVSGNAGGGAGGGIALTVGTLAGSGVIGANGGAGNGSGGGGGGGRIAITYTSSAFDGVMTAYGGSGYNRGGAGTIYTKANSKSWGQVLADNGGQAGASTSWFQDGTLDLTVTGGAVVAPPSSTFGTLLVNSNAWITVSNQVLTVTGTATIQTGGGIIADAAGYAARGGPGAGGSVSTSSGYASGGGGYGGYGAAGGAPPNYSAYGGSPYGLLTTPTAFGSGGGSFLSPTPPGGAGGAAVRMNVTGALVVNGRISANGGAATSQGAGGGAGGSVWLTVGTLAGIGTISANGGAGNGLGGGGGGGCISLQYGANVFEGVVSGYGGGGASWGGAGTIYSKANSQAVGQVLVDNGGNSGTNTPVPYSSPFDLTIRGGAVVNPATSVFLQLSNLFINTGGTLTCLPTQPELDVSVLRNATIDAGGLIAVDGKGFSTGAGPGAGHSTSYVGSGAGYGGNGGASSTSLGGTTYGSVQQPVDRGSGGGSGWQGGPGGGEGGGALRLDVAGALTVNGRISASGNAATQDDGGGGSGGSIWLTAGVLAGDGAIAADGGAGELYSGGGGGGGRIAIYNPVSAFRGLVSAAGGAGFFAGQSGSIYSASVVPAPQVVSGNPTGVVNFAVSLFDIYFSTVVNPASVSAATVSLTAPGGVAVSNLAVSASTPYHFAVTFPQQIAQGDYLITVGPQVLDLLGQPMSQAYTGAFSIVWSAIQGAVTDTNGLPVAGVVLQPDGSILGTTTDTNGLYLLSVPPTVSFTVTPSAAGLTFVPSSRTYNGVSGTISNDNYLAVTTVTPALTTQVQTNSLMVNWYGISGVSYQPLCSTNLVDWVPYNAALPGTNGPLQLVVPMDTGPIMFFRVGASY